VDLVVFLSLAFMFIVAVFLLGDILRGAAVALAFINDLCDLGLLSPAILGAEPFLSLSWMLDVATFILIALSYRSAYSLISLLDLVPYLGCLPLHALSLLLSKIRERGVAKR